MATHNEVGVFGEAWVAARLATVAPVEQGYAADLRFCNVEVEVKTARPSLYNGTTSGYQFKLFDPGHTNFRRADVLVLICLDDDLNPVATYVLPTRLIPAQRTKITIPRSLRTPFDVFRERWDVIAEFISHSKGPCPEGAL